MIYFNFISENIIRYDEMKFAQCPTFLLENTVDRNHSVTTTTIAGIGHLSEKKFFSGGHLSENYFPFN
jgi:hypothetical protein